MSDAFIASLHRNGIDNKYMEMINAVDMLKLDKIYNINDISLSILSGVPLKICSRIIDIGLTLINKEPQKLESTKFCPMFNDPILDSVLLFPEKGIIEFVGDSNSGKTNIVYDLAVKSVVNDPTRKVIFILADGKNSFDRLKRIASSNAGTLSEKDIMNEIMIQRVSSINELCSLIDKTLPQAFIQSGSNPPSLVIIDSISSLFRLENDQIQSSLKSQLLFEISSTLKWISNNYNCMIVVTNQVTANLDRFSLYGASVFNNDNEWIPALGLSWANCLNMRVSLIKTNFKRDIVEEKNHDFPIGDNIETKRVILRTAVVSLSPYNQGERVNFYISDSGIHGC